MDFKLQRRNSLNQEVDGIWTSLEEEEDTIIPQKIATNECHMLRRVLGSDKMDVLPRSCKMMNTAQNRGFMTRLTHFNDSPDVAGKVSLSECKMLYTSLRAVPGGPTFMPMSCTGMLKHDQDLERERLEEESNKSMKQLKKRNTYVAQADYPPTAC